MTSETGNRYEIFKHGATWVRVDFHLHTRKDKQFDYKGEENSFVSDYVTGLKEKNIRIGIITNHNKFDLDEFLALRKKAKKEEIFLLPGIELSVNDGAGGIHTLIVFSDQWLENGNDRISPILSSMFPGRALNEYQHKDGRSDKNILQVVEELDKISLDYFFVFAHVEQNNGLWKEMSGGKLEDFADKRYDAVRRRTLAFQKVRTHDERTKVKKWLGDWYPAEVEGSDNKSIEDIGKGDATFIKIGDFTFEAVKNAMRDWQYRVSKDFLPIYTHSYIKSISFEGGILNGNTITFSPELNTLIGIRGSGKSSIIETLRYALGIDLIKKSMDVKYKEDLVAHTLGSGGKVILKAVDRYGQEFEVKRILNEPAEVFTAGKLQPGVSIGETVVHHPIYFGQKDLANSGEGFEKELVEKLLGEKLYDLQFKIDEQKQLVKDAADRLLKLSNIEEQKRDYQQKKHDAEFRLKKFQEYGVDEKFQKQSAYDADQRKLKQILELIASYKKSFSEFIDSYEDELKNHKNYKSKQNEHYFSEFFILYEGILQSFENNQLELQKISAKTKELEKKVTEFEQLKRSFTDEFAKIRQTLEQELKAKKAEALNLEEFPQLQKKIDSATQMLDSLERQEKQKNLGQNDLIVALSTLNNLWYQEFQFIKAELDKINQNHSSLTIEAIFKGDKKEFLSFMQSMFKGSKIPESTFSSLIEQYQDFGDIYKNWDTVKRNSVSSFDVFEKYFFESLKTLLTWQVPNKFIIYYHDKELKHHSLGQRASALILFVLNQSDHDVVIVDQPEDDLDNQTIYEDVIKLILTIKSKTQFIFATHNANIPVLGDVEQIHACRLDDGEIKMESGSIDSPILQKEIVDIMEGGEAAFNKRKEIYQIWKPLNLLK